MIRPNKTLEELQELLLLLGLDVPSSFSLVESAREAVDEDESDDEVDDESDVIWSHIWAMIYWDVVKVRSTEAVDREAQINED